MEATKCKVCGSRHWGPCYVPGDRPKRVDRIVIDDPGYQPGAAKKLRAKLSKRLASPVPAIMVKTKAPRGRPQMVGATEGKSDRAAYQREYMRRKRSKSE